MPTVYPVPTKPDVATSPVSCNGNGNASVSHPATIEDLYYVEGKAEIVNGKIVPIMTGKKPHYASGEIFVSLRLWKRAGKRQGFVANDGTAFRVSLPNRESFSPDAAYYVGADSGMKFSEGAPRFAAEVRSENDYGIAAEAVMRDKRADYFAAGTLAVWDVDLLNEPVIKLYMGDADNPAATFRRGETAHAGDAVPGWTMPVDDLFED